VSVPIVQLSEVAVVVSDLDRSVRFYTEVLGTPLWDREADHATIRCGNGVIGLWLPGAWALKTPSGETLDLRGGARQQFTFGIDNRDGDAALENLKSTA
jgi:catechol 2,3-dioxygenase-like lactoylglutathione lyase family enzyme